MTTSIPAEWATPHPYCLPDLGPGIGPDLAENLDQSLRQIAADPSVQALVLFGSRAGSKARPESDLDLLVVERTAHLEGEAKVASWWRHFLPLQNLALPIDLVVCGSEDAARLSTSRWHVISEAALHGRVLAVNP